MNDLLIQATYQSIRRLENLLEKLRTVELSGDLTRVQLTTLQIKNKEEVQSISRTLPSKGKHIYFFEIDRPELLKEYDFSARSKDFKYARINTWNERGKCIYVGSCGTIKLSDRFVQHCGHGAAGTYSLQLANWLKAEDALDFSFVYARIDAQQDVLEEVEEGLRELLKPMFGKSGSNNKMR